MGSTPAGRKCVEITTPLAAIGMMNNFTPRAREVLAVARQEAERLDHGKLTAEHLLLGIGSILAKRCRKRQRHEGCRNQG